MAFPKDLERKILTIISTALKGTKFINGLQVIVFGSWATNQQNDTSDIDVAVKCKEPLDVVTWELLQEALENKNVSQILDVVDYNRVKPDFQKLIDETGIVLKNS